MKLKVQHLYYGSELPKIFATSAKLEKLQNGELCYESRWKMRDIKLRHRHPIEYTQIPVSAPQNVLLKLC
ncbi:hypothetical protein F8M41_022636 [Gigaspora margarita]|uniref:Uncharacterized protein n=1 Tax=Gigaspora margarita TaxID=4874 RepID=A0A8H4EI28_GIGMA|nr:hypothetical protein F8M41_022636 [Gigaspora margarita]